MALTNNKIRVANCIEIEDISQAIWQFNFQPILGLASFYKTEMIFYDGQGGFDNNANGLC